MTQWLLPLGAERVSSRLALPSRADVRPPKVSATETASEFIERQKTRLPGSVFKAKDIGRAGHTYWRCEAATLREQSNLPQKVYVVMRIRLERVEGTRFYEGGAQVGDIEYRLGYYTIARNGKWWWGQYALMIPHADFAPLLEQARSEGTLLGDPVVGA
jgi:hypothetical protein